MERECKIMFLLRAIHNQIKVIIRKSAPQNEVGPKSQLQGGILGYLYHHEEPVYQRDLEREFRISRATATNTLQVMERDRLIVRKAEERDARLKRIQMTDEARRGHMQMEAHMDTMERWLVEGLSDSEVEELRRLLGILMGNMVERASEYGEPGEASAEELPEAPPG